MSFFLSGIPILDTQDIGDSLPYINKAFFDLDTQIALLCAGGREFATLASMVSTTNGGSSYFLTKYVNSIAENYLVYLDGVKQIPNVDYTVNSATSSIVFQAQLPPSNITLEVMTAVAVVSYIDDQYKLPLAGGSLTGGLIGTTATFSSSVSAPAVRGSLYGNVILGSNSVAGNNILIQNGLVQSLSGSFGDKIVVNDTGSLRLRYGNLILDGSDIANPYGTINTGSLTFANGLYALSNAGVITARSGTFITSLSAPALSGTFFGDGSRLTGVGTANALSLSGGTLVGPLTGTRATFTSSVSAPAFYGDGSNLTGILTNATTSVVTEVIISTADQSIFNLSTTTYTPSTNNIAVFWDGIKLLAGRDYSETDGNTITLAQPANAGSYFLFEVGKLITRSDGLSGTTATFASISSTYYYGDGSKLTGISTAATTSIVSPEVIISTAGQTIFNLSTITYAPSTNNIAVYWDGIKLLSGRDYSETDDNTITLAQSADAGSYFLFEVGKLITRSDSLSGTTATFASVSSIYYYGDGSRLTGIVGGGGTANALPLSGGDITGNLNISGNVGIGTTASASKLHVVGNSRLQGDVTITGNLSCTGTQTFTNTVFTTTSAISVVNFGSGAALYVGNNGIGDIASFYDIDANVEVLHVGGNNGTFPNVGIKTSSPSKTLTVVGEISATQDIITSSNLNAVRGTFTASVSAPTLSGVHFGDGSKLTGVGTPSVYGGKSGTYTIASSDANSVISFNSSSTCYLQLPSDATNIPIGSQFTIIQEGLGNVVIQIVPSSGVSLQSYGSRYTTTGQYAMATLIKTAALTWRLAGTLS